MNSCIGRTGHIESISVIRDKLLLIEGWHSLEDAEISDLRLSDADGHTFNPILTRRLRRQDVNRSTGLVNPDLGFQYIFPLKNALKNGESTVFKLEFEGDNDVGEFSLVRKNNVTAIESTDLKIKAGDFEETHFFDLLEAGLAIEGTDGEIEVHVEQVLRHGSLCLIKGWVNDELTLVDDLKVLGIKSRNTCFFRFYRKDIKSFSHLSDGSYKFGFVVLFNYDLNSHKRLSIAAYKNGSILDKEVALPTHEDDYNVLISSVMSCQLSDPELIASASYRRALHQAFEAQTEISPLLVRRKQGSGRGEVAVVANFTDTRLQDINSLIFNSRISAGGGGRLYIAIKREQLNYEAEKLIDKLQYLYDVDVNLMVYPSAISNYKLIKDSTQHCTEPYVVYISNHSALILPEKIDPTDSAVVCPAHLCDTKNQTIADGIDDSGSLVLSSDLKDGENLYPLFFGTVFRLSAISSQLDGMNQANLSRIMSELLAGQRFDERPSTRYIALDTFDSPHAQTDLLGMADMYYQSSLAFERIEVLEKAV
ncbi:hypothetical protein Q4485_09805 [Granulosicoccaceae sp. 1_MG-2023]|nr:hypothetical protein [Granulosicoccaceae sp. 1_MG-2023]